MDKEAIQRLTNQREKEWEQIQKYINTNGCRMAFLQDALDDSNIRDCNRCENCTGSPPVNPDFSQELVSRALNFLKRSEFPIEPRKQIKSRAFLEYDFPFKLPENMLASEGRVLSRWADAGWGRLVK